MTMWTIDDQYETMPWNELDAVVLTWATCCSPIRRRAGGFFPGETELHEG